MDTNRFLRMRQIYDEAMTLPPEQRDAYVAFACQGDESLRAEVNQVLGAQQRAGSFMETPPQMPQMPPIPPHIPSRPPDPPASDAAGRTIGPYRLIRELGRGGMGVVFLAVRDDGTFRKSVAVKVLRGDQVTPDFLRRFREERQVLANLDHPYIARIIDGGDLPSGMPYYVMDFVEGQPLDEYCDQSRLSITDRIKLFQKICEAVDYLHSNRVIHRDLKPANILVTSDGTPKLLDFGIAKQQGAPELTAAQGRLLTPGYASPEQISGMAVTKASDIYTLGVILYYLLTGKLPYDNSDLKVANVLAGVEPPKPSTRIRDDLRRTPETTQQIRKRIIGDLDNIVLMSLRRSPTDRYASAKDLADDLQRYLEGRSVLARKDSILRQTSKFVRRNRIGVAVALILFLALGFGTWQTVKARMIETKAEAELSRLRSLLDALDSGGKPSGSAGQTPTKGSAKGTPGGSLEEVRQLKRAFANDFAAAWKVRPGLTAERQLLLDRTIRYLDSLQAESARNLALAIEVASSYQLIGAFWQTAAEMPADKRTVTAVGNYNKAILLLWSASNGNLNDPTIQGTIADLTNRVRSLGGVLPDVIIARVEPPRQNPVTRDRHDNGVKPPQDQGTDARFPPIEPPPQPAVVQVPAELNDRMATVSTKVQVAEDTIAPLKASLEAKNQILHPDATSAMTRMKIALNSARAELSQGNFEGARTNLDIADALANRVLRFAGGR